MQLTTNTNSFIEAEVTSSFILRNLHDGMLGEQFYRNVADFMHGEQLNIKSIGTVTLQEASEDTPLNYNPIETGEVIFQMTDEVGNAWYITDNLREDGNQVDQLVTEQGVEETRAYQEFFETRILEAANAGQTDADANNINGFPHRVASAETDNVFALGQLSAMRLSMDKAKVPRAGRIFLVDPVVETTLINLVNITSDVSPFGKDILEKGLSSDMSFIMNIYGFDIILSNRLPTGTFSDGTTSVSSAVANIAMCVLSDQTKPVMAAWRRHPKVEGERNKDKGRDEFVSRARFGVGVQRVDTLGVIITSAVNY